MPQHRKKILLTDDDEVILATLSLKLRAEGYIVTTAASGSETISRVQESLPDLILLDLALPPDTRNLTCAFENGFAVIAWLRGMGGGAKIPIIIISSTHPEQYQQCARDARIVASFQKPVDHDRLLQVIHETLDAQPSRQEVEHAGGNGTHDQMTPVPEGYEMRTDGTALLAVDPKGIKPTLYFSFPMPTRGWHPLNHRK